LIGKSFGSRIALDIEQTLKNIDIKTLLLTPVDRTFQNISNDKKYTVISGSADTYVSGENIKMLAGSPNIDLHIIKDAGHSLAVENDFRASLKALDQICGIYERFFTGE
jgi:alpha/beta superfamily hydrolase